ncbi:hypothetical protein GIW81_08520 [Hyphomicrobium sp. xq]|uniref:Uncharacterized protein n=1 Tax=Hyphomicrobium album TaxID=2665159 RepID=A0A6I3KK88_9HYPH|nr:hypothetical protein [Hyphomicrobium album]MTD94376.1 hypothetical protein [Hyphomicrobium album]
MTDEIPFCRPLPPTWWGRIKDLLWEILTSILVLLATAWFAAGKPWF